PAGPAGTGGQSAPMAPRRREPELDATVSRPVRTEEPVLEAGPDHSARNLWLAVSGAVVLVLAVIVGIILATSVPAPKVVKSDEVSSPPPDPLDNGSVPSVEGLSAARTPEDRNIIVFSWTNPQPKEGDTYKYRSKSAKADGAFETTASTQTFVSGLVEPPVCLEVILVRADGSASPESPDSIACLDD
ncbi:MAG TPA: serine/threonine protein kinase, partial [Arthrobacter sp.]|nr:serine/threonine protein kinase [Arthrobacter sp.]